MARFDARFVGGAALGLVVVGWMAGCATSARVNQPPPPPADLAPEDTLGVDDEVEVRVFQEPDLSAVFHVAEDGTIDYPLIGRQTIAGLKVSEIQELITTKLKDGFVKNPQVTVIVKAWNSRHVSVLGQVKNPGRVAFFQGMTIVDAILSAGSFTAIADRRSAKLSRVTKEGTRTFTYDVQAMTEGKSSPIALAPGDVVVVEERLF